MAKKFDFKPIPTTKASYTKKLEVKKDDAAAQSTSVPQPGKAAADQIGSAKKAGESEKQIRRKKVRSAKEKRELSWKLSTIQCRVGIPQTASDIANDFTTKTEMPDVYLVDAVVSQINSGSLNDGGGGDDPIAPTDEDWSSERFVRRVKVPEWYLSEYRRKYDPLKVGKVAPIGASWFALNFRKALENALKD